MKNVIRYGVFETNSSSSHSLCVCTTEEYEKFINGELVIDLKKDELIPRPKDFEKYGLLEYEDIGDEEPKYLGYKYEPDAHTRFITSSGDEMVAFCYEIYYD